MRFKFTRQITRITVILCTVMCSIFFIVEVRNKIDVSIRTEKSASLGSVPDCKIPVPNILNGFDTMPLHQPLEVVHKTIIEESDLPPILIEHNNIVSGDTVGQAERIKPKVSQPDGSRSKQAGEANSRDFMTPWEEEQALRKNKLRTVCKNTAPESHHRDIRTLGENPQLLKNILVDDEHKLLYCYVPKVACTQWKRVLLSVTGGGKDAFEMQHDSVHAKATRLAINVHSFTEEEIMKRLTTYQSVMFTRHPLERILSAYRDKFERNTTESNIFIKGYGLPMLQKIKRDPTFLKKTNVTSLTFQDMLEYLGVNPPATNQEHWMPAYHLCHPCTINYTYLGDFEDLFRDSTEILSRVFPTKKVQFPEVKPSSTKKILPEYLSEVKSNVTERFKKIFRLDYDIYGFQ